MDRLHASRVPVHPEQGDYSPDPHRALGRRLRRPVREVLASGVVPMTERLTRLTTALAVLMVPGVAAVVQIIDREKP